MAKKKNPFHYEKSSDSTGFLLWQVHNLWQREVRKQLIDLDLTHTQFVILANAYWLDLKEQLVSQTAIARHAKVDVMMTSNILRTLEKKGLLTRKEHQTDTRAKLVELTDLGMKVLGKAVEEVESFDMAFFSKLKNTSEFNKELLRLLDIDNML